MLRMDKCWWRGMLLLTSLALWIPMRGLAIQTTNVSGTVYRADGSLAQGTMLVSWPGFTAADGSAVAPGNTTVTIAPDGSVSMMLAPNAGANPQGTYYTVVYHMNDGTVQKEYWVVPQAATAAISAIRARIVPAAVAQQSVTQQYVDTSISALQGALQGSYLQLKGGTMSGGLELSTDPTDAMQAATKGYVDSAVISGAGLPLSGGTLSGPITLPGDPSASLQAATKQYVDVQVASATPTLSKINSVYSSTQTSSSYTTYISTIFNEGTSGATVIGTKPATDTPNSTWANVGVVSATFNGSGATFGPASGVGSGQVVIDTGHSDEVITLAVTLNNSHQFQICVRCNGAYTKGTTLDIQGSAVDISDTGNSTVTLATGTVSTWTGTITITLSGQSVSVNAFGLNLSGTIPSGSPTLTQTLLGINPDFGGSFNATTAAVTSLIVTSPVTVTPAACTVGIMQADGKCSPLTANEALIADPNGHAVSAAEKGFSSTGASAWDDDLNAGIYDPRDPKFAGGIYGPTPSAAAQAMSNQMACDLAMGVVSQATAKWPQGTFAIDQLQLAPGSNWEGSPTSTGGTHFVSKYENHQMVYGPPSMTLTCSDGVSHTDSNGGTRFAHFLLQGCATGGCSNAAGDTGSYTDGGPYNTGIQMSNTASVLEYNYAEYFGGYGIRLDGQDAKAFHNSLYSNDNWYYFGGYKGLGESAAGPESSATTTGTTGSVALSWAAVPSATGYVVYRGTAAGNESVFYLTGTNSFTDTGAAPASSTVTNVVTTTVATPGVATATPSTTGGVLAAGTYYYKVTATTADGWHGSIEFAGADDMADWVEAYGLFDAPTIYTYHHLADILGGGGDSHFDHMWPQLGQVGIAQPYAAGFGDVYENVRIDFARLEGFWTADESVQVRGGVIDGSCTAPNAVTINTGQDNPFYAGTCDQLNALGAGSNQISDIHFADNNGFGATQKTADYEVSGVAHHLDGVPQYLSQIGVMSGGLFTPSSDSVTNVTGPAPSITGLHAIYPSDTAPITYGGFMNLSWGQDFYVLGGNANVTLQYDPTYLVTCSGQNINLGNVSGFLHFRFSGGQIYSFPTRVAEICPSQSPIVSSSETVTFSATPTFSIGKRASILTLTGNVTSFTLPAATDGQEKTLTFCQNATGGFAVTAPANVHGFFTVGKAASKCSSQHFTYSTAQAGWLADSSGVTNE